jgi:phosphoribosylanthranilate isomerase
MSARVRVKFCGLVEADDAAEAVELGVAAIGVVFVPGSKRYVSVEQAAAIRRVVPPFVSFVALFMNATNEFVHEMCSVAQPDLLQFHGSESAAQCEQYGRPYIKAIAMGDQPDLAAISAQFVHARGLLLDAHSTGQLGGAGISFDWHTASQQTLRPIILAGGLTAENVAQAIRIAKPYAVDVSSGIESAPGKKSSTLMKKFMEAVNHA